MPKRPKKGKPKTSSGLPLPNAPQRLRFALDLLDEGERYMKIRQMLMDSFKISHCTAEEDIKRAYKVIADETEAEAPQLTARVGHSLWRVAKKAEREGDYSAAVSALGRFAKLHGLEAPKKHHVTGGVTEEQKQLLAALAMTPVERQKRIAELEAEAAQQGEEVESTP
jgi:hypothetical protein